MKKERNRNFISPNLWTYKSLEELKKRDPATTSFFTSFKSLYAPVSILDPFDDRFQKKRTFVVAEPGYGKTRVLKEIIIAKALEKGKQGIFIDLKKVDKNLDDFILNPGKHFEIITPHKSEEDLKQMTLFKTGNFQLIDSDDTIICLDALDEVKQDDFSNMIDRLKYFFNRFPNVVIFISCRTHHLKKYENLYYNMDFIYAEIGEFGYEQVREYLKKSGISEEQIERVFDISGSGNIRSIISIPRYLEMMVKYINERGVDSLKNLKLGDLLDFFIYRKLELEGEKADKRYNDITKRVLEKLALLMEIYQANVLTKDELMTFFDDVESNLNIDFRQQVLFYDRSLLKDNIDSIEFENTSFQEYLAAKEIVRLGRTDQVIFDLAIDKELREIYPPWFETLGFAIDLDISLLKPLIDFGSTRGRAIDTEDYYRLLTTVDTDRLPSERRIEIFKIVLKYYQDKSTWIDYDVSRKLCHYFDISLNDLLKRYTYKKNSTGINLPVRRANVVEILAFLFENKRLGKREITYWKKKLLEFVCIKNQAAAPESEVLNREVVYALSKLKDMKVFKKIIDRFDKYDHLTIDRIIQACIEIDPNDFLSIECFIKRIKSNNYLARLGLKKIISKEAIKRLLDRFIEDNEFLEIFIYPRDNYYMADELDKIFQNIRNVYDEHIEEKILEISDKIISRLFNRPYILSEFTNHIFKLIRERNANYIFTLISAIKKQDNIQPYIYPLQDIFTMLLNKGQVDRFVEKMKPISAGERIALNVIWRIKEYGRKDALEIYEEGRKHFEEDFKRAEDHKRITDNKTQAPVEDDSKKLYEQFKFKMEPEPGKYPTDVFSFYLRNKEAINGYINDTDKSRLEKIIRSFFEICSPDVQELVITDNWTYDMFGDCIRTAIDLYLDISEYKKNILRFIPYADFQELEAIFSIFNDFNETDVEHIISIYNKKRKDNLLDYSQENFVKTCERYNIVKAIPILKGFIEKPIPIHERMYTLEVISKIEPNESYLKEIFDEHKFSNDEDFKLAEIANQYLIEKFADNDAIKWRFNELKKRHHPFTMIPMVVHLVTEREHELKSREFARPIYTLKESRYISDFLELLDKSFEIYKEGNEYHKYAQYLWGITIDYFQNLKEDRSYEPLQILEKYTIENSSRKGINWFLNSLLKLKREYMIYIGKPQFFADCIKKYNRFKNRQYIDIASARDLFEMLKDVIENDLKKWVEDEGAYKFIQFAAGKQEDLIQKTIKTQFENCLLRRGLRENEINIKREAQLLDNQRTDFLIYYGFIGPVLIEIKRADNKEVNNDRERLKYTGKLKKYMMGNNAEFGIYLIFKIKEGPDINECLASVRETLKDYSPIYVTGLDCIKKVGSS